MFNIVIYLLYLFWIILIFFINISQCLSGCLNLTKNDCQYDKCSLSNWSEWSECTDNCSDFSKRIRKYLGQNCTHMNHTLLEEKRICSNCSCSIYDLESKIEINFKVFINKFYNILYKFYSKISNLILINYYLEWFYY
jgi:hypothetical protein